MMMGKGAPGQMPPQQMMQRPPAIQQPQQRPMQQPPMAASGDPNGPLSASALAAAPPQLQKQMLGEKLFPQVAKCQPELAGKIVGMMLEMDNSELLILLESQVQLEAKVNEALRVLQSK